MACLLSGTLLLDLLTKERLVLYRKRSRGVPRRARLRSELRVRTVNIWQPRFNEGKKRYGGEIVDALSSRVGDQVGRGHGV